MEKRLFARILQRLLAERRWEASELAEALGCSLNAAYDLKKETDGRVQTRTVYKVADALRVSPTLFLTRHKQTQLVRPR